jgi:hypothetical protein
MKPLSGEFVLLVLVALCGFGGVAPLLSVSIGMAGFLCASWPKYFALWGRAKEVGGLGAVGTALGFSALNSLVAVLAAYGLGAVMRMLAGAV